MTDATYTYEGMRRITYGDEGATFVPVCRTCGRFVKADVMIRFDGNSQPVGPTATCAKCGRTHMLFEGYL